MQGQRGERGSATVEFALVLPLVLTVLLGVVQVGMLLRDRVLLAGAAREAARAAAVGVSDEGVLLAANASGLPSVDVQIQRDPAPDGPVTVVTHVHEQTKMPLIGWLIPDVDFRASATMRQETGEPLVPG